MAKQIVYLKAEDVSDRDLADKVIAINRVAKVVKGGRRFSFSALVCVGDKAGAVGIGVGKAGEVPEAIKKAISKAKKRMVRVSVDSGTLPHQVEGHFGAGYVLMKPASKGTGLIAGGAVRAILEVVGVRDVLAKSLGTSNAFNVCYATLDGLRRLKTKQAYAAIRADGRSTASGTVTAG